MKLNQLLAMGCVVFGAALTARAQAYRVGDTVQNFTLTDRATGRQVGLEDFSGKIVFLEWFAWWCPFCQAAAPQVRSGIVDHYAARGGNPAGLPVLHVAVNLQAGQETQTQQFVDAYGIGLTLNDFNRALANRFQPGGQPIFAIINGVAGSLSHRQWELVFSQLGYGSTQAPITDFRRAIDSVRAAATVEPPAGVAPAITAQPLSQTVTAGTSVSLSVAATGTPVPTYQWQKNGDGIPGATAASLTLNPVTVSDAGNYTVVVTNSSGAVTSATALLTVNLPVPTSWLANLSVRTAMATGQTLIVGAVVSGGAKTILVRAAGPALHPFGLMGMADPRLELFTASSSPTVSNDDWPASLSGTFAAVGAFGFPSGSKDAAFSQSINGAFTVQARGTGPGVILVEAYDVTGGVTSRLINLSARNQVGTGENVLIAGLNTVGTGTKQVLIRAVRPGLAAFGVGGTLVDPKVQVYNGTTLVATNDNWDAALTSAFQQVGAFGLQPNSRDAALLVTLNANTSYTVQVSGTDSGTGEALIEVYEVF